MSVILSTRRGDRRARMVKVNLAESGSDTLIVIENTFARESYHIKFSRQFLT